MTVKVAEDRSMCVQPNQTVRTAWIDIDKCKLGSRTMINPEAVEKKFRRLLNMGDAAAWPPIVGHWEGDRFVVDDGRHEYLASLMIGREKLFVCWLEDALPSDVRRFINPDYWHVLTPDLLPQNTPQMRAEGVEKL